MANLFHGSDVPNITEFKTDSGRDGWERGGLIYLTSDPSVAARYGSTVYTVDAPAARPYLDVFPEMRSPNGNPLFDNCWVCPPSLIRIV